MRQNMTHLIERLEVFEERAGVRLDAPGPTQTRLRQTRVVVSLYVMGELHPRDGTTLENDVDVAITVYDSDGKILRNNAERFAADEFFGFFDI